MLVYPATRHLAGTWNAEQETELSGSSVCCHASVKLQEIHIADVISTDSPYKGGTYIQDVQASSHENVYSNSAIKYQSFIDMEHFLPRLKELARGRDIPAPMIRDHVAYLV